MRRLFLRDCQAGDIFDDVFVIANKQLSATNTGKHFIKALVSDRSAQLSARMWNATREIFNYIPDNGFAKLRGRVENYQNNLQLIIESVGPAMEGQFELADLLPTTAKDVALMLAKISELIGSVQNRHVSALLHAYLDDKEMMDNFVRSPAAMSFHHAYIGGLLEHTLNAMEVADAIVKFYPGLNRDLLLAGVFLHDIAKTWELSYSTAFGYTDGGQLVGHIVKSAMWIEEKARSAEESLGEKVPRPLIDVLQHIVLSHHGEYEFGSPRLPSTPEAIAVHMIENLDAKLMMALCATRGENCGGEAGWTEYMKAFNGKLYRPDHAPADAPLTEEVAPAQAPPASAAGMAAAPMVASSMVAPPLADVAEPRADRAPVRGPSIAPPAPVATAPVAPAPAAPVAKAPPPAAGASAAAAPSLKINNPLFSNDTRRR